MPYTLGHFGSRRGPCSFSGSGFGVWCVVLKPRTKSHVGYVLYTQNPKRSGTQNSSHPQSEPSALDHTSVRPRGLGFEAQGCVGLGFSRGRAKGL